MAYFLLKLLGVKADHGAVITHPMVGWHPVIPLWAIALIGLLLAALAVWLYRREDDSVPAFKRWTMALLRIVFLGLILLVLARPVLSFTMESTVRRGLVVLVDTSISMGLKDQRTDAADLKRAGIAMGILDPTFAVLDETDSGLDIDALRIVGEGINAIMRKPDKAVLLITHYQRLLDYVRPDFVHVLADGRIVRTGGAELALELEEHGYEAVA